MAGHRGRVFFDEDLLEDLRRVCREVGAEHYGSKAYISHGRASLSLINNRFGNFAKASARAGLVPCRTYRQHCTYSDAEILAGLRRAYRRLGPLFNSESFREDALFSLDVVKKRFGSWNQALALARIPLARGPRRGYDRRYAPATVLSQLAFRHEADWRACAHPTKERCLKCDRRFVSPNRKKFRLCAPCRQANDGESDYGVAI
jgi:hypothetical protein